MDKQDIKILTVEDDLFTQTTLRYLLEKLNYKRIENVMSGEDALRKVRQTNPDIILMDIMLDGEMDGIETADRIHKISNAVLIYMSSLDDMKTFERAKQTEPFAFIRKPANIFNLRNAIEISIYKKEVEEELRRSNENLRKTQQALLESEKISALGRFSAGIAHEIRNPLANIYASAQYIMKKIDIDENLKKHFNVILKNSEAANNIIKELLDFTSGREMRFSFVSISKIIEDIYSYVEIRCRQQNVRLEIELDESIPKLHVDESRLKQAFLNFITNSLDAMASGGRIRIETHNQKNKAVIKFSDNGTGIPPEHLDKVMEPFYTTKSEGTGLGLSISYQIIKGHDGELEVKSTHETGTTITVTLPILIYS